MTNPLILIFVSCLVAGATADDMPGKDDMADKLIEQSQAAAAAGDMRRAIDLATQGVDARPDDALPLVYRGSLYARQREHKLAVRDFDRAIELDPRQPDAHDYRGSERLALGQIDDSIADFDRAIALDRRREPGHWKRGIAYYYAGQYEKGRQQFEGYQTVDGNDVENAVWRFLCMARQDGVEKARRELLKIKHDRRVPMMEVYSLFAGKATADHVLTAARAGKPGEEELLHRLFYAELYLGLYAEALGEKGAALRHLRAAVDHKIGHFMWDVAKMHLARTTSED